MHRVFVILFVAVSLFACRSSKSAEKLELDPLFTLPFAATIEVPPIDHALPTGAGKDSQLAYQLTFRFYDGGQLLQAPALAIYPAQRASIRVLNQISYISDFDVEVAPDAFIAEPVISVLQDGLSLDCVAVPEEGGERVVLAWRLDLSEVKKPIRTRKIVIARDHSPVTVQLPAVTNGSAVGRTLLHPGVETRLTQIGGDGTDITVYVSATPIHLPKIVTPERIELDPFTPEGALVGISSPEPEAEPLLDLVGEMDPPEGQQLLNITLATLKGHRLMEPLHLEAKAAESFLEGLTTVSSQTIAAAPEDGARISWTTSFRSHTDYQVTVGNSASVHDPIVTTMEVGFRGRFGTRDGEPVLAWSFGTLVSMKDFTTKLADTVVSIELPEMIVRRGLLRIRSGVNILPVGPLTDGRSVVLVVKRVESR